MLVSHAYRWRAVRFARSLLPPDEYPGRKLDVYWLSTGRCGTHYVYNVIRESPNLTALHDDGMFLSERNRVVDICINEPERFWDLRLEEFPWMHRKVAQNFRHRSAIFTELIHRTFPYGYMLFDYFERKRKPKHRVKLVHLVRHPVSVCRSMLKVERKEAFSRRPTGFLKYTEPAINAANLWIQTNRLCRQIVDRVSEPSIARTIRIEDLDVEGFRELYDFMEIKGFDENRIALLVKSRDPKLRSSHILRTDLRTPDVTEDEIEIIARLTKPLAVDFGYRV